MAQGGLGIVAEYRGNYDDARVMYETALSHWRKRGNRYLRWADVTELQPGRVRASTAELEPVPVIS